jgi:DNA-binding CsgD family transcriptional regulator
VVGGHEWPLVGREREIKQLRELLREPGARGAVLAGAAGVGKTRLADEALRLAERAGMATARATATRAGAALPLGALALLLPPTLESTPGAADDRAALLRRSAAALVERAGGRRLALFVDDANLLDDASAVLVQQLAATDAVFVLLTVRTGEPVPDPVTALWKDGLVPRIEVAGLGAEAIDMLLTAAHHGPVDPATSVQFAVRCQGNVLFLRELVLGALADGTLTDDGGIWHLTRPLAPSDRLVELIEERLRHLEPVERDLLELLSFGEPLDGAELARLADGAVAEHLERQALVTSRISGRGVEVRLTHPLYGDVLRSRTPALRSREICRRLAEAAEAEHRGGPEESLRIGTWRLEAGGGSPELLLTAATTARWRYDFPLAERLARAAIEAGAGVDAGVLAAQMASLQGRGSEADVELSALVPRASNDAERARIAIARVDNHVLYLGRVGDGLALADEAAATVTDPVWRAEIAATRAAVVLNAQGVRAGAEAAEEILENATGRAFVVASLIGSFAFGRLGRTEAALDLTARGYAAHLELETPLAWYPWYQFVIRCWALMHAGRLEEAETLATAQYQQGVSEGSPEARSWFAAVLAAVTVERGHVTTAARHANTALTLCREMGRPLQSQYPLLSLALALAIGDRPVEARAALADFDKLGLPDIPHSQADRLRAEAWIAIADGDLPEAARRLDACADLGARVGDLVAQAAALHDLARIGHAKRVLPELAGLAGQMDGELIVARLGHTRALVDSDPDALEQASAGFERIGSDLYAGEAAIDAAVAWRAAGDTRRSSTAEQRGLVLVGRCEGASTPGLQRVGMRVSLTPAERETAMLAASGRSNREIAAELYISVRTVENRLQQVYQKLGVSSRAQLAACFSLD